MAELHPISTPAYIFIKPSSSDSNSTSSPTSLLSPNTLLLQNPPLLPHLIYPNPPPPNFHTVQYHPLYFSFPPHPVYFHYPPHPRYCHFYPQPVAGPHPVVYPTPESCTVAPDPRRSGFRGRIVALPEKKFTGGGRGHRNFHGDRRCTSVKKVWKPKEPSSSSLNDVPQAPSPLRVLGDNCTTLMIKNIPNHISRSRLIELLEIHCHEQKNESPPSRFDFVYLPFDFQTGKNLGYAFVNFTTTEGASRLYDCWENKGWDGSAKIRKITRAKLQGKRKCKKYFQISRFCCHTDDYLPVLFSPARDGSNGGNSMMITIGTLIF